MQTAWKLPDQQLERVERHKMCSFKKHKSLIFGQVLFKKKKQQQQQLSLRMNIMYKQIE